MRGGTGQFWPLVLVLVFYLLPIVLAGQGHVTLIDDETTRTLVIGVVAFAALFCVAAMVFLGLYLVTSLALRGGPVTIRELRRSAMYAAVAGGLMLPPIAIALGLKNPRYALVYAVLVGFYLLYAVPGSRRSIGYRSSVTVRCTPEAAFALVSDPHNWPRYLPQLQVIVPVESPLRVGSIVNERVTVGRRIVDGQDEVTLIDPNRKLGMLGRVGGGRDLYEFRPVDAGTEISYTVQLRLSVSESVIGGALRRGAIVKMLLSTREATMQRIKQILEAPPATPV